MLLCFIVQLTEQIFFFYRNILNVEKRNMCHLILYYALLLVHFPHIYGVKHLYFLLFCLLRDRERGTGIQIGEEKQCNTIKISCFCGARGLRGVS